MDPAVRARPSIRATASIFVAIASRGLKAAAAGSGGSGASQDGTGEDDFVFRITREEFMNYFFDDLELPRLIRTQLLADAPEWKTRRAGFVSQGNPTSLHVVRSMRVALGRRIAMGGDARVELRKLEEYLKQLEELGDAPAG